MPRDYISRKQTPEWRRNYDIAFRAGPNITKVPFLTMVDFLNSAREDESFADWKERMRKTAEAEKTP